MTGAVCARRVAGLCGQRPVRLYVCRPVGKKRATVVVVIIISKTSHIINRVMTADFFFFVVVGWRPLLLAKSPAFSSRVRSFKKSGNEISDVTAAAAAACLTYKCGASLV